MTDEHHLRCLHADRQDHRRGYAFIFEALNLETVRQLDVIDDELDATIDILRSIARARNQDQVTGELDEPLYEARAGNASLGHSPIPPAVRSRHDSEVRCTLPEFLQRTGIGL